MAFRTVLLLSIITLNNSQSSKENFKPKGVTSGVYLRAHRKAEGGSIWSKEIDNKCVFVSMVVLMFGTVGSIPGICQFLSGTGDGLIYLA